MPLTSPFVNVPVIITLVTLDRVMITLTDFLRFRIGKRVTWEGTLSTSFPNANNANNANNASNANN